MGLTRVIRFVQKAFYSLLPVLFLFSIVPSSSSNTLQYIYDDLGRLRGVFDENGSYAAYDYDEVGNLLSISNGTTNPIPPLIQNISPDCFFIGSKSVVTITGQNLFSTRDVVSDNPGVSIRIISVSDTSLKAELIVSSTASSGTSNIIVSTSYGSTTIGFTVLKFSFNPARLATTPASNENIIVSISPVLGRELTISISNSDSSVISIPQSVIIPSSGTTTFNVSTLSEGVAILSSPDSNIVFTTVYVTQPLTTEPEESITSSAAPVSVSIQQSSTVDAATATLPVSVYIELSKAVDASIASLPVSVYIQQASVVNATSVSGLLSVYILPSSAVNATTSSLPVSVYVQQPTVVDATTVAAPVSVYKEPPSAVTGATAVSVPVSALINAP